MRVKAAVISICSALALVMAGAADAAEPLTNKGRTCPTLTYTPYATIDPTSPWPSRFVPNRKSIGAQDPLTAPQSIGCIQNPSGFRTELWASEDMFTGPMKVWTVTFDERGRAWLCETFDYPNTVKSAFAGSDRIRILEDTNGDRIADKSTIFVDGLSMPSSLVFTVDGVVVAVEDHMVLFEDKDGDDKADVKTGKILYTGWSRAPNGGDTHGMANNLAYGIDNWIYGNVGYNGGNVNGIGFSSGSFRFRQDGSEFQWFATNGSGNSWGWGQMEDGQSFASHATGGGHAHHEVYQGISQRIRIMDHNDIKPITPDVQQGDVYGGFSATTNATLYSARYFPREYWARSMFVNEGEAHLVHQDFLTVNKSTWKAGETKGVENILASKDAWTAPIFNAVGPDGALWVVDFHNYLWLHNGATPAGEGGAYEHGIRDHSKSRVYRVVRDDATPLDPILDLAKATTADLVKQLGNSNLLWRLHAQRLLIKRGSSPELIALLDQALDRRQPDEMGIDAPVIHALWVRAGLGATGKSSFAQTEVMATSQTAGQTWKYTTAAPAADWFQAAFVDAAWSSGQAPFANAGGRTAWTTPEIWARRSFNPGALTAAEIKAITIRVNHDEDVDVYINGVLALSRTGYITGYEDMALTPEGLAAIKAGQANVVAAHCKQTIGGQFLDIGLYRGARTEIAPPDPAFLTRLKTLLLHPSAAVRRAALGALPLVAASAEAIRDQKRLCDPDAHVRIKALDALRFMPAVTGLTMRTADAALDSHVSNLIAALPGPVQTVENCNEPSLETVIVRPQAPLRRADPRMVLALGANGVVRVLWSRDALPGILRIRGLDGKTLDQWAFDGRSLSGGRMRLDSGLYFFDLLDGRGNIQLRGKVAQAL